MATRLIALLVLALSLLPISGLIPGGESDPEYLARVIDWANGLALCGGLGGLAAYIVRARRRRAVPAGGAIGPSGARSTGDPSDPAADQPLGSADLLVGTAGPRFAWVLAGLAFVIYALIAQQVFSGNPLLVDEIVQVLQARWYAAGHLSVPTPPIREFFSLLHVVDLGDRTYSQFPAGGPAMLALGTLLGGEWLVGPIVGALSVLLFARLLALLEPGASRGWHRGTTALFALTPFGAFMFGSHMNHATTLVWLLLATVALGLATARDDASPVWGLVAGVALGAAASIRPMDGAAFALPAAGWLLWRARLGARPLMTLLLSGVGIALPLGALMWVNLRTTGRPLLFGYDLLWGAGHGVGFHRSPWGPIHTPLRGLELVGLYFTRLSIYLFETPFPALVPAAMALWLRPVLRPLDRFLFASALLVIIGYWAYWHDGFYLGPRFMFSLLPVLVLWSARSWLAISERFVRGSLPRIALGVSLSVGALYAAVTIAIVRAEQYRNGMTSMRVHIGQESAAAGVHDALVLVKESWGSQLIVRLWARGVSRSETEILYRTADACRIETVLQELEVRDVRGAAALERLRPLQADSALLVPSTRSPDYTERMLPGLSYSAECEASIRRDQQGFSQLAPLRLAEDGNVYARWLPGREAEIEAQYPGRAVYLLERESSALGAPFIWRRLGLQASP
ncbi:MAG: hypothetical protein K8S21_08315 [Gemmatimonadetes bacterium]|nr:hypothetical protein [Gemmatimonadota bacterium]